MTLWLDLDIILYRGLHACSTLREQVRACDWIVDDTLDRLSPDDYELVMSGPNNFRYRVDSEYKANRPPKPTNLVDLKNYYVKYWNATITDGIEADDYIATNYLENDIIATTDKDYRQLDAWIYNLSSRDTYKGEGTIYFFIQMLTGDKIDNIPGIKNPKKAHWEEPPNFTEKTARMELIGKTVEEMKELVQNLYDDQEKFHRHASLLWLRRSENDSYIKHI